MKWQYMCTLYSHTQTTMQVEAQRCKEHTFEPNIITNKPKGGSRPIQERIGWSAYTHQNTVNGCLFVKHKNHVICSAQLNSDWNVYSSSKPKPKPKRNLILTADCPYSGAQANCSVPSTTKCSACAWRCSHTLTLTLILILILTLTRILTLTLALSCSVIWNQTWSDSNLICSAA